MLSTTKFFNSVLLAIVYATFVSAEINHSTHRSHVFKRGLEIRAFHPESSYETFGEGIARPVINTFVGGEDPLKLSTEAFVSARLDIESATISYKSGYTAETAEYGYVKQAFNNITFANAVGHVAFKGDKVVAFGSSFIDTAAQTIPPATPTFALADAVALAEDALDGKVNNIPASLEYVVKEDGSVVLAHVFQLQNTETFSHIEAFVDAHGGEIVSITEFTAHATYTVTPVENISPDQGIATVVDPQDLLASPLGWHDDGTVSTNTTSGNNVISFKGVESNTTTQSSDNLVFDYPFDPLFGPTVTQNTNAARVNLFHILNLIHDVAYRYGFTESAFNFQTNNFGKGGAEGDRVLASVQDSDGVNNAFFSTPPDGQSGFAGMFIFTITVPNRDGSLVNDIPAHEMTHGITNRMTGGGTARCLQTTEAGGMGEGWSDTMADWLQAKANFTDFATGRYVLNNTIGVRQFPYSTNTTVNPLRYSNVRTLTEVHRIGTVWATILHNVLASLITELGFSETARTNPEGTEGNIVFLHLLIDALALQPCNPTFITARNAWFQADVNRYAGANKCLLWKAFASRGLGLNAAGFVDNADIPADC